MKLIEGTVRLAESTTANDLKTKFDALFPSWPEMLATLLSLLIIMFVLGPLVFTKIKDMVASRRKYIQDNIDNAEKMNNEAIIDREKANNEILHARTVASEILSKAKLAAEKVKTNNLATAKDEANKLVALAKADMLREKEIFAIESRNEMITVAMAAARNVVEEKVDSETSIKIIEEFINK